MQQLNLSVDSCGSVDKNWQKKSKKPIIQKIIKRDGGDFALILAEDPSKPLRFLYLCLLTDKQRLNHIKLMINKIKRLIETQTQIQFEQMSLEMRGIWGNLESILKNLIILQNKMEKNKQDHMIVMKLVEQHEAVDPLLVLALRAIGNSEECKIKDSLKCDLPLSLNNTCIILNRFGMERREKNELNRFILFIEMKEIDVQFLKAQGIAVEDEISNCEELFDPYLINYQQEILLEGLYSDL